MRMIVRLSCIAGALTLAACSGKEKVGDSFKADLERASTASDITLPTSQGTQVVSEIERTTPPARNVASSQRVARRKPAPTHRLSPVEVRQADVSTEVETAPVEPAAEPVREAPLPSPRPQPVATTGGGTGEVTIGSGRGDIHIGSGIGAVIGVILRGGVVDGDDCDPRTDGRNRGVISINSRIPVIGATFPVGRSTFPGSGRVGGGRRGRF